MQALGTTSLRAVGLTRQKARYVLELAEALRSGRLRLNALGHLDDEEAKDALMAVPGIGPWTAKIWRT